MEEAARSNVSKGETERLVGELSEVYPISYPVEIARTLDRKDLIDKVTQCRFFLNTTVKCREVLEDRLVLKPPQTHTQSTAAAAESGSGSEIGQSEIMQMLLLQKEQMRQDKIAQQELLLTIKQQHDSQLQQNKSEQARQEQARIEQMQTQQQQTYEQIQQAKYEQGQQLEFCNKQFESLQKILQRQTQNDDAQQQSQNIAREHSDAGKQTNIIKGAVGFMPSNPMELTSFFSQLERQFVINGTAENLHVPILNQLLNDKARQLTGRLDINEISDYKTLKASILREFQLTPAKYRDNFMSIRKRPDESYIQFTTRLEVALQYYLTSRTIVHDTKSESYHNLFQLLVSDRLKENVSGKVMDFVRMKELDGWLTPHRLAELLDTFVADTPQETGQASYRRQPFVQTRPQTPRPPFQTRPVFQPPYMPNSGQGRYTPRPYGGGKPRCYLCGGEHLQKYCMNKQQFYKANRVAVTVNDSSNVQESKICVSKALTASNVELVEDELNFHVLENNCSEVRRVCTNNEDIVIQSNVNLQLNIGDRIFPAILDSGTEITVVPSKCVEVITDKEYCGSVKLTSAFGETVCAELCKLKCALLKEPCVNVDKCHNVAEFSNIEIVCAVTHKLHEDNILLCLDDYRDLYSAHVDQVSVLSDTSCVFLCEDDLRARVDKLDTTDAQPSGQVQTQTQEVGGEQTEVVSGTCRSTDDIGERNVDVRGGNDNAKDDSVSTGVDSKFSDLQWGDDSLVGILVDAEKGKNSLWIQEDTRLVFKRVTNKIETRDLLVLPKVKRDDVLRFAHDKTGHYSVKKCMKLIGRNFWWPCMKSDVVSYCSTCIECAGKRRATKYDNVPIKPVEKPNKSFDIVSIDIFGPIEPVSARGHKYVLGIICLQSRWVECYPLKSLKSKEICDCLLKFVAYAGIPRIIISDNGANMVSNLNKCVYDVLGIELRTSTPFHSQGNALIERFWGTFRSLLHHVMIGDKPRDWDLMINMCLFAYRNVPNSVTGLSPYELVFGHSCRNALDVLYDVWSGAALELPILTKSDIEFYDRLKSDLSTGQKLAETQAREVEQSYIDAYNRKARDKQFSMGEQVLILMPDSGNRLRASWIGPGVVTKKVSDYSYLISLDNGAVRLLHANKLRKFTPRVANIGVIDFNDEQFGDITELPVREGNTDSDLFPDVLEFRRKLHDVDFSHLSADEACKLKNLLCEYRDIFSDMPGELDSHIATHEIKLLEGSEPKLMKPYRIPEKLRKEIDVQIDNLLKSGRIRESKSPYGHPIVCVAKPNGEIRMCVDYRHVNKGTVDDKYPMKRVDDMIYKMSSAKFFTTLDCTQGYYQIPMEESSIPLTAFVTHRGQYENVFMPFGLKCASQTFQRALDKILSPVSDFAESYIDDVCCYSTNSFDEHLHCLEQVFSVIRKSGLTLKLSKCQFGKLHIKFVGHVIGQGVVEANPDKIRALLELPPPTTKKKVRSVLAMFRYYSTHIPNFSEIALPLVELTKDKQCNSFVLNDAQLSAFDKLKKAVENSCKLYSPCYDKPFVIHTDASEHTIAACLSQVDDRGRDCPIAFSSKKLSDSERKWSVIEKEAYAIIFALKQYDYFIFGNKIELYTDHNPLTYIVNCTPKSAKLTRWCLGMQRWNVTIKYKNTRANVVADCLTRV